MKNIKNKCGIGYINSDFFDAYFLLLSMEHRGQESAGIAGIENGELEVARWLGKVHRKKYHDLKEKMEKYREFLVHTRYATTGSKRELLRDSQPLTIDGEDVYLEDNYFTKGAKLGIAHNGQIVGSDELMEKYKIKTGSDTEVLLRVYKEKGIEEVITTIPASYSAIICDKDARIAFRDRHGIRPLWYGEKNGLPVISSEDFPIRKIGGKPKREIEPGEVVFLDREDISFKKFTARMKNFASSNLLILRERNRVLKGKELAM